MAWAAIGPIEIYLPEMVEDNDYLAAEFPRWNMEMIYTKTGIRRRHIARADQCASDLAVAAAERLFARHQIDRRSIDFLVYGLALAEGLIRSGVARRVLLLTAETYSRYIHPADRSLRTIFGDGAAATLVEASEERSLGSFVFGTDGSGGDALMVIGGGARPEHQAIQPRKRRRWPSSLFMDGPALVKFTLKVVPPLIERVLSDAQWRREDVDYFLMHQATTFMLDHLRQRLALDREHLPEALEDFGNTVSSTLPILMYDLRRTGRLRPGKRNLLIGFGVGFSWAGCAWVETWEASGGAAGEEPQRRAA